jgi:hypothetical protein
MDDAKVFHDLSPIADTRSRFGSTQFDMVDQKNPARKTKPAGEGPRRQI